MSQSEFPDFSASRHVPIEKLREWFDLLCQLRVCRLTRRLGKFPKRKHDKAHRAASIADELMAGLAGWALNHLAEVALARSETNPPTIDENSHELEIAGRTNFRR